MEVCGDMDESLSRLWSVPVVITPLGVDMGTPGPDIGTMVHIQLKPMKIMAQEGAEGRVI
jgi:hypothetical protein